MRHPEPRLASRSAPVADRRSSLTGWIGTILIALFAAFNAMFAAGEMVSAGWEGVGHLVVTLLIIAAGLLALTAPLGSLTCAIFGVILGLLFGGMTGAIVTLILLVGGACLYLGRPRPLRAARWVIIGLPVLAALATVFM